MNQSTISDITEIEQLLARYAVGMTRDDVDAVMDVFTPDGA
jgi:ketosteroid isomerase-like protein